MFSDEEWPKILIDESSDKVVQAKLLLGALPRFVLFAQPNPGGAVFIISHVPDDHAAFALEFSRMGNAFLEEMGVRRFRGH